MGSTLLLEAVVKILNIVEQMRDSQKQVEFANCALFQKYPFGVLSMLGVQKSFGQSHECYLNVMPIVSISSLKNVNLCQPIEPTSCISLVKYAAGGSLGIGLD